MFERFNEVLQSNYSFTSTDHILLAVSGGVDSVVLFHLLQKIPKESRPQISIAHINHQLRPEADQEEQFVRNLAKKYGLPFYTYRWEKDKQPVSGIESAARSVRYRFFQRVMKEQQIDVLMTAHHQDDQAETILMRLARGGSLEQLTGIQLIQNFAERSGVLFRPLLIFSKDEIYQYASKEGLEYVEDATNLELDYTRNRFRNQIIPLLKKENSRFNEHIEQFSSDLTDLLEIAEQPIKEAYQQVIFEDSTSINLNIDSFTNLSSPLQRAVLVHLLNCLYENKEDSYKTNYIDLIQQWLLEGEPNTRLELQADIVAQKVYNEAFFYQEVPKTTKIKSATTFKLSRLNEWIKISENEMIGLFLADAKESNLDEQLEQPHTLLIAEEQLSLPLTIRHRKAGDRMTYTGLNGTKKIKDIFIDEKVPLPQRDDIWLVEDSEGTILWLINYRKMDLCNLNKVNNVIYILKYKKD